MKNTCVDRRRRMLIALAATLAPAASFAPLRAFAQQRRWRIAVLNTEHESEAIRRGIPQALRAGLRERGYSEDRNLDLIWRFAASRYEQLPKISAELVQLQPDILVTHSSTGLRAMAGATKTIPIVVQSVTDPVALGFAASLSKPGGNVTGSTFFYEEVAVKRLQILKEVNPKLSRVAITQVRGISANENLRTVLGSAAKKLQIDLHRVEVTHISEMEQSMADAARAGIGAIAFVEHPMFLSNVSRLADIAASRRLLAIGFDGYAAAGGAMEYGIDFVALWHRVGYFVDRILKGTAPGEIPFERPSQFNFIVNRRSMDAQGIRAPSALLLQATRIIE